MGGPKPAGGVSLQDTQESSTLGGVCAECVGYPGSGGHMVKIRLCCAILRRSEVDIKANRALKGEMACLHLYF